MMKDEMVKLAAGLEFVVVADLRTGRANDGTTALLAAANELRRRIGKSLDPEIALAVSEGMSLRNAAASFGVTLGRVRGAVARGRGKA